MEMAYVPSNVPHNVPQTFRKVPHPNVTSKWRTSRMGVCNNHLLRVALTLEHLLAHFDAFTIFLALLLAGTWMQRLFN
ncbi:hypothetical protein Enr8_47960 [Blastopirellula retiformator]|uniref:Uncharacterized protein n=1 Tax=Blastopirellula retiformator TaxID=2527970 RepID=A0A5C5UX54_9BACT|nr:hypothetical protein Enr8_47960 [Blastopirellula retiformator]